MQLRRQVYSSPNNLTEQLCERKNEIVNPIDSPVAYSRYITNRYR